MKSPSTPLILMADDDEDDRLLIKDAMAECQMTDNVRFVHDGEELLDYLLHRGKFADPSSSPAPGLILLDLNMPRKDGHQALREIRAHADLRRIPVVVFTTSKADREVAAIYESGANSFVPKPTGYEALVNIMKTISQYWFGIVELPKPGIKSS
jgi:CheY-like chemotaxis protein